MVSDDLLVQGVERVDRQLADAAALAGHLVPVGSMFAFLAAHRAEVFPDADYADLFAPPGVGRASLPATQMAAVLALQALCDYSDRETAEAVRFDVRWKVAIGAAVDDAGFDPSSLVYWRNRIAKSARPHRVNDAVKRIVEQTGVLKGRRRCAPGMTTPSPANHRSTGMTRLPRMAWSRPWSTTPTHWWPRWTAPRWRRKPPPRWRCWPWSPARTSNPPRAPTAGTGGGGSPARSPKTGSYPLWILRPGTPASHPRPAATGTGRTSPPTRRPGSSLTRN